MSGQGQKARARRAADYAVLIHRFESGGWLNEGELCQLLSYYHRQLIHRTIQAEGWKRNAESKEQDLKAAIAYEEIQTDKIESQNGIILGLALISIIATTAAIIL